MLLKTARDGLKHELKSYQYLLRDARTPRAAKVLLGMAVGYTLLPFDLIPDFIPVVGQLDDLLIVPGLVLLGIALIPQEVIVDARLRGEWDWYDYLR